MKPTHIPVSALSIGRRSFLGCAAIPLVFPSILGGCARAQDGNRPVVTPEMFGWTEQSNPVETAESINRALAAAVERGVPFFDNAVRRVGGTIRLGGKVVMEFGTQHRWIADYSDLSRFATVEENPTDGAAPPARHVFVDTSGARDSIIRGPMFLTGAVTPDMSLASRSRIPSSLVALTATTSSPASQITVEQLTIEGFGYGFYQGSQRTGSANTLPYTRMEVGTLVFRYCLNAIETGEFGNGLDDATFQVMRISRCGNGIFMRGTDLNVMSLFYYGLNPEKDAEQGTVDLEAGSNVAIFEGYTPRPGSTFAVVFGRDRPNFVGRIVGVDGREATLSHIPQENYVGSFVADPPSTIVQNSAVNAMHYYIEGAHDLPLALRAKSKASIRDLKVSRGSFAARGGTPISIFGPQTAIEVELNPRAVGNPMVAGVVGLMRDNASVGGRLVSGDRLATGRAGVIDTRPVVGGGQGTPTSQLQGFLADYTGPLSPG